MSGSMVGVDDGGFAVSMTVFSPHSQSSPVGL